MLALQVRVHGLAGDGCTQEGISHDFYAMPITWILATSLPSLTTLASTIDSHTNSLFHKRMLAFETYGWQVVAVGGGAKNLGGLAPSASLSCPDIDPKASSPGMIQKPIVLPLGHLN